MAAGTKDEPRDEAAAEQGWSPVPPPRSIPQLPNDRLGFAGSGLFGLGALLVAGPPKPQAAQAPREVAPEPMPEAAVQTEGLAPTEPVGHLEAEPSTVPAPEQVAPGHLHSEPAEVPLDFTQPEFDPEPPAETPSADADRPDPMPDLIADLNRRMHGIEQRLDITLLEIEQATRELRDAAKDQREAAEMLRAVHLHQRAPRDDKPASGGIRPASLAASDLVPHAAMPKVFATDAILTAPAPAAMHPDPVPGEAASVELPAPAAADSQSEPVTAEAVASPVLEIEETGGAASGMDLPLQTSGSVSEPATEVAPQPPADSKVQESPSSGTGGAAPADAEDPADVPAGPARQLRWLVLTLILIAFLVWLLGPERGYLSQVFDLRAWGATLGWAANGLDQAHVMIVEWSDAFRRMIRG